MLSFKIWVGLGHIRTKKHLKLPFLAQNYLSVNGHHFFCDTLYKSVFLSKKKKLKTCIFLVNIELGSAPKKANFFSKEERGAPKKFSFFSKGGEREEGSL